MRQRNEIPPSRKAVAVEGISGIFSKPRHGCGRNFSMVLYTVKVSIDYRNTRCCKPDELTFLRGMGMPLCDMSSRRGGCGGLIADHGISEPHHEPEQGEQTWELGQW